MIKENNKQIAYSGSIEAEMAGISDKGIWRKFFRMAKMAKIPWLWIVMYMGVTVISLGLMILMVQVSGRFNSGDASVSNVIIILAVEMVSSVFTVFMLLARGVVGARVDRNFRNVLWKKILHMEPKFFDEVPANALISRITSDVESLKSFLLDVFLGEVTGLMTAITTVTAMATMDVRLAYIMAVFIPIVLLVGFLMGRLRMRVGNALKKRMADLTEYLSGQLARLTVIKAYNKQEFENMRGQKAIEEYYLAERASKFSEFLQYTINAVVYILPDIALMLIGIKLLETNVLTVAGWVAFHSYAQTLIMFFTGKSDTWISAKNLQGQLNRVSDLLSEPEEGIRAYAEQVIASGDICFEDVTFGYDEEPVLENVSITIPNKAMTAILGPNGTGKSTILKLIERMYQPQSGRIMLSGKELDAYDLRAWRDSVSIVNQEATVLSGTIRENVLYGVKKEVSDEQIMDAARKLNAEKFILECPEGLDQEVGQFGEKLSGGQRQKLAIIRAYLQDRDYILLDEPTANLDAISSVEVVQTVQELKKYKTVIMVAHDYNLIKNADHIIVLNEDHSAAEGSVKQMIEENEFFRSMGEGDGNEKEREK